MNFRFTVNPTELSKAMVTPCAHDLDLEAGKFPAGSTYWRGSIMLRSRILGSLAVAALMAGIAATEANGAEALSPAEQAATADLNKKSADDSVALDASEKAKQEAYEQ